MVCDGKSEHEKDAMGYPHSRKSPSMVIYLDSKHGLVSAQRIFSTANLRAFRQPQYAVVGVDGHIIGNSKIYI